MANRLIALGTRKYASKATSASVGLHGAPAAVTGAVDTAPAVAAAHVSAMELVDRVIALGVRRSASDIHLEPTASELRVRLRVDGLLEDAVPLPKAAQAEVIARIKVMARLRTDERQAAQDGRFRAVLKSFGAVDVRVSVMPTNHGENAVLRLLKARGAAEIGLEALGFSTEVRSAAERALARPHGLILATGPTGSGKTTTLYSLLAAKNVTGLSVATIEDPIEYSVDGITQIAANPRAGLGFAAGLRALLRQDPDVIMVGEIRDEETAALAVNAALTGHLVLSTLHTNDAPSALVRLLDLGVAPYLVASTVSLVLGQRLIRKVCGGCRERVLIAAEERERLSAMLPGGLSLPGGSTLQSERYVGRGCVACGRSGYAGRLGVYEALVMDEPIRAALLQRAPAAELKRLAVTSGMTTMAADAWKKAAGGVVTYEETIRVLIE